MQREEFDLCVIGAGINGGAVARDGAMRGLRVALVDAGDFAGATSSRSSKLIHGGFRYLPQGQMLLVYRALRERERLRRVTAPHLVHPIRFLFPTYRGRGYGRFTMSAGLALYDLFARAPRAERHRTLGAEAAAEREPLLSREGLTGAALYYDAWADDARITLENVLDAALNGAAVANYAAVVSLSRSAGKLRAAAIRDLAGSRSFELRARAFVNAAGPWVDDIRRMDDAGAAPSIRLTKGVHLVLPAERIPVRESLVLSTEDRRIVFVMPRERYVLVGTTDTDYQGDRREVVTGAADVGYLLGVVAENLPSLKLSEADVASSFAGLRALVTHGLGDAPSAVPREEVILGSESGMLTVAGGKLTTHREIAEKVIDRVLRAAGRSVTPSLTRHAKFPGARPLEGGRGQLAAMPRELGAMLIARYGTRAEMIAEIAAQRPDLAAPLAPRCPAIGAEVVHAIRSEMAFTVADFLVRRTALVWRCPFEAEAAAPTVARIMAAELGWERAREESELAGFVSDLRRRRAA